MIRTLIIAAVAWVGVLGMSPRISVPVPPPHRGYFPVQIKSIHDADTLRGDIILPWGVTLRDRDIRTDYDAWEIDRTRRTVKVTPQEILRGKAARQALVDLAAGGTLYVSPTSQEFGEYNRLSASLWVQSRNLPATLLDVKEFMRANGHLRPEN